jgi:ABC-type bacteriocin/lantibiotic exporter with double-glycine peptidase domain
MPVPKPYLAPPVFAPEPNDPTAVVLRVPGYYQIREYTCGFVSTLTVLRYFRRYVPERVLYERLGTNHWGTSQNAIVRELRREGLSASVRYDLDFDRLCGFIDRNRLVVTYHHRLEHWIVVHGYAPEPRRIYVAESLKGMRRVHRWALYGEKLRRFGIVCGPRGRRGR